MLCKLFQGRRGDEGFVANFGCSLKGLPGAAWWRDGGAAPVRTAFRASTGMFGDRISRRALLRLRGE